MFIEYLTILEWVGINRHYVAYGLSLFTYCFPSVHTVHFTFSVRLAGSVTLGEQAVYK